MTSTGPWVYDTTMNNVLSDSYGALKDIMNHMKSLKLKSCSGENFADCCDEILVDDDCLES